MTWRWLVAFLRSILFSKNSDFWELSITPMPQPLVHWLDGGHNLTPHRAAFGRISPGMALFIMTRGSNFDEFDQLWLFSVHLWSIAMWFDNGISFLQCWQPCRNWILFVEFSLSKTEFHDRSRTALHSIMQVFSCREKLPRFKSNSRVTKSIATSRNQRMCRFAVEKGAMLLLH